jgi:5'-nucleotidase
MSGVRPLLRAGVAVAIATGFVVAVPLVSPDQPAQDSWTPMTPVAVSYDIDTSRGGSVKGSLLSFNDFHGALEPRVDARGVRRGGAAAVAAAVGGSALARR